MPSFKAYLREAAATVHHPVGSCRMGIDAMAVVDPHLKVRGIEALRVVDAAVFPGIVGGNTNAPDRDGGRKGRRFDHGAH